MNNHRAPMPQVPLVGQAPTREQLVEIAQRRMIDQLSLGIYSQIVAAYLPQYEKELGDEAIEVLNVMALNSRAAAKAYYEALGIRFE